MNRSGFINEFCEIYKKISDTYRNQLPLNAAENIMSDFCKLPLSSSLQEKYILGSAMSYDESNNFLGSSALFELYNLITKQCNKLFASNYSEARTLSGLNAILTLLMSLFNSNDKILITSVDCGGHSSLSLFCKRLGIHTENLPYDYEKKDFDYDLINSKINLKNISGIVICLSDIAFVPKVEKLVLPKNCILIYDVTQILGLIAGNMVKNPFDCFSQNDNVILVGATHKTFPGPTCGLIMSRNLDLAKRFDRRINPDYLRNIQLHQIASLIFALAEFELFGKEYAEQIVSNSNELGKCLQNYGFNLIMKGDMFSETHQLFINNNQLSITKEDCHKYGISVNFRNKPIYEGLGIRIGTQEITRYGYTDKDMQIIAKIFYYISRKDRSDHNIKSLIETLSVKRDVKYSFTKKDFIKVSDFLHDNKF